MKERRIELPFALGVSQVVDLRAELLAALRGDEALVVLDAREVDSADTLGLQLMVSFVASAEAQARTWRWEGVSEPLRSTARLLGLDEALRLGGSP